MPTDTTSSEVLSTAGSGPPTVAVNGLTKRFQAVTALSDVSIDFHAGSVHVLFGENGAGKSTLIKLLAGVYKADSGRTTMNLDEVHFTSPRDARHHGISAVFQDPALVPQLSVAENLALGREHMRLGLLDRSRLRSDAVQALRRVGCSIDPSTLVRDLSRAEHQLVEIARALQDSARVLILDEPTAALTDDETDTLFRIVDDLRKSGLAIIYITHRMQEIRRIGDEVSVLRDGALVSTCRLDEVTDNDLITMMTGRAVGAIFPTIEHRPGEVRLEFRKACSSIVHDASLTVRAGEIVGLAGLIGSGKSDLGRLCFGLAGLDSGQILINGANISRERPSRRIRRGLIYYPADRKLDGLVSVRPVRENVSLSAIDRWSRRGFLRRRAERMETTSILERLGLRPMSPEALPSTFSGGNQQKIVLARGFARDYEIHVFDEPTAGVDVGARADIYQSIKGIAERGAAVLLISSDLPEVLNLAHRVYVMAEGRVVGEFTDEQLNEQTVLPAFFSQPLEAQP